MWGFPSPRPLKGLGDFDFGNAPQVYLYKERYRHGHSPSSLWYLVEGFRVSYFSRRPKSSLMESTRINVILAYLSICCT